MIFADFLVDFLAVILADFLAVIFAVIFDYRLVSPERLVGSQGLCVCFWGGGEGRRIGVMFMGEGAMGYGNWNSGRECKFMGGLNVGIWGRKRLDEGVISG